MDQAELKEVVLKASFEADGRRKLSCSDAFRVAEEHSVAKKDITEICNSADIRICGCQLGCFK